MKLGIYKESHQEYHASKALSNSGITILLNQTAAHFKAWFDRQIPEKKTDALSFGQMFHTLTLEPERFAAEYHIKQYSGNTKEGRKEKQGAAGKILISQADYQEALNMAESAKANPRIKNLLHAPGNQTEVSIYWTENINGVTVPCKARIDFLTSFPNYGLVVSDLKSTQDASPEEISKTIFKYGYYRQEPWYKRGLQAIGQDCKMFSFIFVEKTAPYLVSAVRLPEQACLKGLEECELALRMFAECSANNHWPGYDDKFITVDLPAWAYKERNMENVKSSEFTSY